MKKLNSMLDVWHSYIVKIGRSAVVPSKVNTGSGSSQRLVPLTLCTLACSVLIFASCLGPETAAETSTEKVYDVSLFAGTGEVGNIDGIASIARFYIPHGVTIDPDGTVYVADTLNNRIRKITSAGEVSLLAGNDIAGTSEGSGSDAQFNEPHGVAVSPDGTIYVVDTENHRIRKITPAGVVSLLAGSSSGYSDGTGSGAQFSTPSGIAVGSDGTVYVADTENHRIRQITSAGEVSLLAGSGIVGNSDGTGSDAQFNLPSGVAVGPDGTVYVADNQNHQIRKITPAGEVSLLAGSGVAGNSDGTGSDAQFDLPSGVAVGPDGTVYVADNQNHQIRKITPAGEVSLLAGSGTKGYSNGLGSSAQFRNPIGVTVGSDGTIYVADFGNNRIRKITPRQVS